MKLLNKYTQVNLLTTIAVMFITGLVYYLAISFILTGVIDKALLTEEQEIYDYVALNNKLPHEFNTKDQIIQFFPAPESSVKRKFFNTTFFDKRENEYDAGRELITSVVAGGKYYKVSIMESRVETDELIKLIFGITSGVILLLLLTLYITNRLILRRLWQPFYQILKDVRIFSLTDHKEIAKINSNIDEFNELNNAVSVMSARVKNDYKELKTFTENASHELLTPIAVINSKLDTLLQTSAFSEQQSKLLNDLYTAVSKLGKLNQSLLLLVKIENQVLHDKQLLNLKPLIDELIVQFDEIFQDKQLAVSCSLMDREIYISSYLADILLNNLLSNAIRHNYTGGSITIELTQSSLIIKNTGEETALQAEKIFTRFQKSPNSEGSGLGLTISRQICEGIHASLDYNYHKPYHVFTVKF